MQTILLEPASIIALWGESSVSSLQSIFKKDLIRGDIISFYTLYSFSGDDKKLDCRFAKTYYGDDYVAYELYLSIGMKKPFSPHQFYLKVGDKLIKFSVDPSTLEHFYD